MNECLSSDALDAAALGGELTESVRLHLQTCGDCAAALEQRRVIVRRFDAVVATRANAQLPSDLSAGVLAQIQRSSRRGSGLRVAWRPLAVALAAGIIVLVLAGRTVFAPPRATLQRDAAPLISWRSPTAALLQPVR